MFALYQKIILLAKILYYLLNGLIFNDWKFLILLEQFKIVGPSSLFVVLITSFFISLVFSLQIVKEFLYLNAINLVGSILAISFVRELSPVLTAIIIVGKVGSLFTSELATMVITEQIDALYLLGINPIDYLLLPRILAVICILPLLNFFSILTSFISSAFICFILYDIDPLFFFYSIFYNSLYIDILKSLLKTVIFGLFIALLSCVWGMTATGGSKGVGLSTTSSVVISLISVFIIDFLLSYLLFDSLSSVFSSL
uniref:ABC transporter permease n=1 Tax=Lophocladia kuetzingii TaxID=675577 RepID=A0A1Z1MN99_9FLOR|nr:hypothetical protein [Lophocladia kuetzingii]ARW67577.1 hypothetical protein [Lophocladia kuetzingii]